jgi:hypothetical protein
MISTLDISSVTDRLVAYLNTSVTNWPGWTTNGGSVGPFTIEVSGKMPETVRTLGHCQMTMYLFHVNAEAATRNTPLTGTVAQPNKTQAFGLTLYYLLTAYTKDNALQEQQALSIAIKAFHERGTYIDPADGFTFTITLDAEKPDEANRRWQSYTTAFRLSVVYRVSVVFLSPTALIAIPAAPPQRIGLSLAPMALPFAGAGALTSTASRVDLLPLHPHPGDTIVYDYSPAVVAPGGSFAAFGGGLDQPTAARLYLIDSLGLETEVTAWKAPAAQNTASRVVATLPAAVGAMPAASPVPGVYQLRVGSDTTAGDAKTYRSNSVPVLISAQVNSPAVPWHSAAGIFSFTGAGFAAASTELLLDTVGLRNVGAAPNPGEFQVAGNTINFQPSAQMSPGTYFVRLRVNGVEGPPVGQVTLP